MATKHFNGLSEAEQEMLVVLAEECNEVGLAVMKILRHGFESRNPTIDNGPTNRQELATEIGHVECAITRILAHSLVATLAVHESWLEKNRTIGKWLHHSE